ncbi:MAG TPA: hypothetical protein VES42_17710, partial [Pilimelia sp.]|nr:hypothetical protein [Pilimelia sp.]
MSQASQFGIVMTGTARYAGFLAASVATLRQHNDSVPVQVSVDSEGAVLLQPVADQLGIELVRCEPLWTEPDGHAGAPDERIGSRLMKIEAIAEARF